MAQGADPGKSLGQANKLIAHATMEVGIAGFDGGAIQMHDLKSGAVIKSMSGHQGGVNALDIDRGQSGNKLFSGGNDGLVKVWDLRKYECLEEIAVFYSV
jgi:WD40 repeat protein